MDNALASLLASKLKISELQLKTSYLEALCEYTKKQNTVDERQNHCSYKFISGENSGKICGLLAKNSSVEASSEIDGKYYCKAHFKTISEKNKKSQTLKLTGIKKPVVLTEKFETERMGDFEVLKGTMLIVDRSKNCCSGKIVDGQPNNTITKSDEVILVTKKIPYYKCEIEDEEVDIEKSEKIDLDLG